MRPWGSFASLCSYTNATWSTSERKGVRPWGGTSLLLLDLSLFMPPQLHRKGLYWRGTTGEEWYFAGLSSDTNVI